MPIISIEIMKIIDQRETQRKNKDRKEQGEEEATVQV